MQHSTFRSQKALRDPIKFVFTVLVVLVLVTSNAALEPWNRRSASMLFIGPFLFSFHSAFRVPGIPSFLVLPFLYLKKPLLLHLGQLLMHRTHR